jgi:putative tryptophan/tyrosine transport system substrate-binding protein
MAADIKRREFLPLLAAATVWPLAARAQQSEKIRRVGVLPGGYRETDTEGQARVAALLDTLRKLGWSDGRNLRVEVRWLSTEIDQIREQTAAVVASTPDVIVISSNPSLTILQKLEKTISTVFVQISDPVGSGFVGSLAHPDGNLTGFQNFEPAIGGKWLGLLKEIAPGIVHAGVVVHPDAAVQLEFLRAAEAVAPSLGVQMSAISVRDGDETERGITQFAKRSDCSAASGQYQQSRLACRIDGAAAFAGDLSVQFLRDQRRADFLWIRSARAMAWCGRLCRSHPARRQTGRSAGAGAYQV